MPGSGSSTATWRCASRARPPHGPTATSRARRSLWCSGAARGVTWPTPPPWPGWKATGRWSPATGPQSERFRARDRRHRERAGERGRDHAPSRARDRRAHRAWCRRARALRLRRGSAGAPVSANTVAGLDTVAVAAATPDRPQPYEELGLTKAEYARIRQMLGRRPTDPELALYSVMWSEHCSYKSSKVHLRQFAAKAPQVQGDSEGGTGSRVEGGVLLAGIGHNAGVVDIGQGYAVTFKIESHNHPSYVEPFQGAATGVGGIVRDILAMGARP